MLASLRKKTELIFRRFFSAILQIAMAFIFVTSTVGQGSELSILKVQSLPPVRLSMLLNPAEIIGDHHKAVRQPELPIPKRSIISATSSGSPRRIGLNLSHTDLPVDAVPAGQWFAALGETQAVVAEATVHPSSDVNALSPAKLDNPDQRLESPAALVANQNRFVESVQNLQHSSADLGGDQESVSLNIKFSSSTLSSFPSQLYAGKKSRISLTFEGLEEDSTNIFVRNTGIVSWDPKEQQLKAKKVGTTEVYVAAHGNMLIIPVSIGEAARSQPQPALADDGFSHLKSLNLADLLGTTAASTGPIATTEKKLPVKPFTALNNRSKPFTGFSQASPFELVPEDLDFVRIRLQLFDEQSHLSETRSVPAVGVKVEIVGTGFSEISGAKGESSDFYVPRGARFFVATSDQSQYFSPSVTQVYSGDASSDGTVEIKLMQNSTLGHLRNIAGVNPAVEESSLCGIVRGQDGKPFSGLRVFARYNEEQATEGFYFNEIGLPGQNELGAKGRFCFLSLEAGPLGIEFFDGDQFIGSIPVSTFAGKHLEQVFDLTNREQIMTRLASLPAAHEIDYLSRDHVHLRRQVDMAAVISLSDDSELQQVDFGYLSSVESVLFHQGRSCYVANATEFNFSHYCLENRNRGDLDHVTSLVPNGFVAHIFNRYNLESGSSGTNSLEYFLDPLLGQVIVEYGSSSDVGVETDFVEIELLDEKGKSVGGGVHVGEPPLTRALFFNLEPGAYSVLVRTDKGVWLAMDTVTTYSETTSFVQTGAQVGYRPGKTPDTETPDSTQLD